MPSLLSIKNLSVEFETESGTVQALKNISVDVGRGEDLLEGKDVVLREFHAIGGPHKAHRFDRVVCQVVLE